MKSDRDRKMLADRKTTQNQKKKSIHTGQWENRRIESYKMINCVYSTNSTKIQIVYPKTSASCP